MIREALPVPKLPPCIIFIANLLSSLALNALLVILVLLVLGVSRVLCVREPFIYVLAEFVR